MTKFARWVIFIIILITPLTLSLAKNTFADYLIRPILDDYTSDQQSVISNQQLTTDNRQLTTDNYIPSITFGDLLQYSPEEIERKIKNKNSEQETYSRKVKTKKVQDLLTKLYDSYQQELAEFNAKNRLINQPADAKAMAGKPTPYIPIPTLLAKVYGLVTTPTPTLHPQIEKILTESRIKNQESGIMDQSTINNQQLTISNIGILNQNPEKNLYKIALLGDSMTDTLGKNLPHLNKLLTFNYPDKSFVLLNYGQGGTDLESGLYRLTNNTTYLEETFPPLLSHKPDILIIESFAYNHWGGQFYDLDRQWLTIAKIIDTVKMHSPETKIIMAATIAPNAKIFGDGVLNWPAQLKWDSAAITKAYLQNMINFATSEGYPLVDAYRPSMDSFGNGKQIYINSSDNIHPSLEGARLFSEKVFEVITENNFIK